MRMLKGCASDLFAALPQLHSDSGFADVWHRQASALPSVATDIYSPQSVVGQLVSQLPSGCALSLANSSTVRYAQHFCVPSDAVIICNRGVNGIEGSLSAAVGYAVATTRLVVAIVGDLSFFYDSNALYNNALPSNLRIVLLNDGGGSIFSSLSGLEQSAYRDTLVAASHRFTARGLADSFRCWYLQVSEYAQVADAVQLLFAKGDRAVVAEFLFGALKRQ